MPQVYNGCGTWYYGKKNERTYAGVCDSCNAQTMLSSYDTRLYVVFLMIPIIPLRRMRIIEKCPHCTRHRAMHLEEWQKLQARMLEALEEYRKSPLDTEKAHELIGRLGAHRDAETFSEVAKEVEANLGGDSQTLCMLAAVHKSFAQGDDASRLLEKARQVEPDSDDVKEGLAELLLNQNKAEEAEPLLAHIVAKGASDRVNLLYHLAQTYQTQGNHDKAVEYFDHCEALLPEMSNDDVFLKLREVSRRNLGSSRSVKPSEVAGKVRRAHSRRRATRIAAVIIPLVALAYLGLAAFLGTNRRVFLVNGLSSPYAAVIDGTRYELGPNEIQRLRLAEGEHTIEMADARTSATTPATTITIATPFLSRPFLQRTFVINPDRTALLVLNKAFYGGGAPEPVFTMHSGDPLYAFKGVDHPFEDPPERISVRSGSGQVSRWVLAMVDEWMIPPDTIVGMIYEKNMDRNTFKELAKWRYLYYPDDVQASRLLYVTMPDAAERLAFLEPLIDENPINVQRHLGYQSSMEEAGRGDELEPKYAALAAANPADKRLLYLHGRTIDDTERGIALIQQAASGEDAVEEAQIYMARHYLSNAQFEEAAAFAGPHVRSARYGEDAREYLMEALIGGGKNEEAMARIDELNEDFHDKASNYFAAGHGDLAQKMAEEMYAEMRAADADFRPERDTPELLSELSYYAMDKAGYMKYAILSESPQIRFKADVTSGSLIAAERVANSHFGDIAYYHLCVHLAAAQRGDAEIADRELKRTADILSTGDRSDRKLAAALLSDTAPDYDEVMRLVLRPPSFKALVLLTLAKKDAARRADYLALARKLNYSRQFPHMLIEEILAAEGGR